MFPDLRSFIERLRRDNDLVTVEAPVDPHLEVAEIHRRVIAAGGPALLFTNVKGSSFRLAMNLFGTARRAELAFGERPLRFIKRVVHLAETLLPPTSVPVHPTQLYEMFALVIVAALLLRWRRLGIADRIVLARDLMLAGAVRFAIEFVRINRQILGPLTLAQLWSLALVVGGLTLAAGRARSPAAARSPTG
jgi:prolipoprotein diacylglyceryltransferase